MTDKEKIEEIKEIIRQMKEYTDIDDLRSAKQIYSWTISSIEGIVGKVPVIRNEDEDEND